MTYYSMLIEESKKQYVTCLERIEEIDRSGRLINLTQIYNDFGRPTNRSPRREIGKKWVKDLIQEHIVEVDYRVEEVIQFENGAIFTNLAIAKEYLIFVDVWYISRYCEEQRKKYSIT